MTEFPDSSINNGPRDLDYFVGSFYRLDKAIRSALHQNQSTVLQSLFGALRSGVLSHDKKLQPRQQHHGGNFQPVEINNQLIKASSVTHILKVNRTCQQNPQ